MSPLLSNVGNPISIEDWYDLDDVRNDLGGDYTLTADLDSNTAGYDEHGTGWNPIGIFKGTFNGNGFTISGLEVDSEDTGIGLFSDNRGTVKNLNLTDINVSGYHLVGAICGRNLGVISNVSAGGSVSGTQNWIGGLVGENVYGGKSLS